MKLKTVDIHELDSDKLMALIDEGERFYVRTNSSGDVLPEPNANDRRDTFWFEEAPCAIKPIRLSVKE